jgi:trimeric autotransporter adhesin
MKIQILRVAFVVLATLQLLHSIGLAQGAVFTYQGRLNDGGSAARGKYDFRFRLASDSQGSNYIGSAVLVDAVQVTDGLFTATLDFGSVFTGSNYWLEVDVRTNGAAGYTALSPLQALTAVPYAQYALTPAGPAGPPGLQGPPGTPGAQGIPGPAGVSPFGLADTNAVYLIGFVGIGRTNPASALDVNGTVSANNFVGNGAGLTSLNSAALANGTITGVQLANGTVSTGQLSDGAVNGSKIADGSVTPADLNLTGFGTTFWLAGGNIGTTAGLQFLGTSDNQPLELKAFGTRALRIEPNTNGAPNMIGGSPVNFVDSGIVGATIGGGGTVTTNFFLGGGSNHVSAIFGTIGGGRMNTVAADHSTIGGGLLNTVQAFAYDSVIGGGAGNTIQSNAYRPVISGGSGNTSAANYSTIGGGLANVIQSNSDSAAIGGGYNNSVSGQYATIPGGYNNVAAGAYSFAAGRYANALHEGSFVWADDSSSTPFASTLPYQFSVRAHYGARFETAGLGMSIDGERVATFTAPHTFGSDLAIQGNLQLGATAGDYRQLQLFGGNSLGFLFGSYPYFGDGVHLCYNFYADGAGNPHVINPGGGTARITAGYGQAVLAVGQAGFGPNQIRLVAEYSGVSVYGTFNNLSDRNAKQDFAPVSSAQILNEVLHLPISQWSYKEDPTTRHIGPVSQDFYSIFNIGTDERHLAPIDEGGVALAAIQGLNQRVTEKEAEVRNLQNRLDELQAVVNRLAAKK